MLFILLLAWGINHNKPLTPGQGTLTAKGYGGPIEMAMTVSPEGTITGLKVIKHNETSSYISQLDRFLGQFIGRTNRDAMAIGKDIDAISGATITSTAITAAVRERLDMTATDPRTATPLTPALISLALFLIAAIALVRKNNALRWAALIGGFIYFGVMAHTMLSIIQVVQAGLGHIPSFTQDPLWWAILTLTFISALIVGRLYCGSLCPFASVQEVLHQLTRHTHPLTDHITPEIDRKARMTKYVLLFLVTGVCLVLGNAAAANIEPFITLFAGHGSKLALVLLALMMIMAVFNARFWCKYLCPVGALTSLASAFSMSRIRPTKKCTGCGTCSRICPTQAISTDTHGIPSVDAAECIVCGKCLRTCPENALTFGCGCHEKK